MLMALGLMCHNKDFELNRERVRYRARVLTIMWFSFRKIKINLL